MKLLNQKCDLNHEEKPLNKKYLLSIHEMLQIRGGDDQGGMEAGTDPQ